MSTTIESSAVLSLLAIEVPYENYFVLVAYERWSLPHYIATIRENYKYAAKDKAYLCFYKALERFSGDPNTAKESLRHFKNIDKWKKDKIGVEKDEIKDEIKHSVYYRKLAEMGYAGGMSSVAEYPYNGNYNIVLQFASDGNLQEYLSRKFISLQWIDKLNIAKEIVNGLT
ncbi:hypothetical protein C2G38_2175029 [Gigaspora rosea]|uniref:Uncharacterized protein n=1 Tax=Gigaspora rosea TaxID=44941 RepID=A0A397VKZ4_9GLOM|nr:hypothetical protein C2G38_2175029 [Gigaspora rosea]